MTQMKLHEIGKHVTFFFKYAEISGKLLKTCLPCFKTGNLPFGVQNGLLVTHVCKGAPENFAYACKQVNISLNMPAA
jgi:hypothetical protein